MERAVEREESPGWQNTRDALEHALHLRPGHDVCGVGRKYGVGIDRRPGLVNVELDRRYSVADPRSDPFEVFGYIARLPHEVRQLVREVGRVLSGARSDLQHAAPVGENPSQDGEDRLAVALAGFGIGFHRARWSFMVATGPRSAPRPKVDQASPQDSASMEVFAPPARSSAQPKTNGLTTPAPKPTTERTAYATPR